MSTKKPAWHEHLHHQWVCEVFSSGYHNGCHCQPDEPHEGWDCGYRWTLSLPDTAATRRLLRVTR